MRRLSFDDDYDYENNNNSESGDGGSAYKGGLKPMEFSSDEEDSEDRGTVQRLSAIPFSPIPMRQATPPPPSSQQRRLLRQSDERERQRFASPPPPFSPILPSRPTYQAGARRGLSFGGSADIPTPKKKHQQTRDADDDKPIRLPEIVAPPAPGVVPLAVLSKQQSARNASGGIGSIKQEPPFTIVAGNEDDLRLQLGYEPYVLLRMPDVGAYMNGVEIPEYRAYGLHRRGSGVFDPVVDPEIRINAHAVRSIMDKRPYSRALTLSFLRQAIPADQMTPGIDDVATRVFPQTTLYDEQVTLFKLVTQPTMTGGGMAWDIVPSQGSSVAANFFGEKSSFQKLQILFIAPERKARLVTFFRKK